MVNKSKCIKLAASIGKDYGKMCAEEKAVIQDKVLELSFIRTVMRQKDTVTLARWRGREVWRRRYPIETSSSKEA